ncbi:XisI protein [Microcoleus sp. FACHB-1515]|uniref:XisI protein n=1 Tax=Cyanophyceae TaxID=3028117 RepID=UPI0016849B11|nr:XisI protein [Microcoleus sp. FACHB-1515]MBD2092009.1 XisI protein [Microcoleus sp. FACHB-1515]
MDRLDRYRNLIKKILTEYYELGRSSEIEAALAFDEQHDQYLLLNMGWKRDERIKSTTIHVRIQNEKIWIEEDWTEDGVVTDLLEAGVPNSDIVLAFHPPHLRKYTEFAIA